MGGGIGHAFNVRKKNGLPLRSPFYHRVAIPY
jgi:hypothetical protein